MHFVDELAGPDSETLFRSLSLLRRAVRSLVDNESDAQRRSLAERNRNLLRSELLQRPVARSEIVVRLAVDLSALVAASLSEGYFEHRTAALIDALITAPGTVGVDRSDSVVPTAILDAAEQAGASRLEVARLMGWPGDHSPIANAVSTAEPFAAAEKIVHALETGKRIAALTLAGSLLTVYAAVWRSESQLNPTG